MTTQWKYTTQGPLNDWPSVVDGDGKLIARTYGPNAEDVARKMAAAGTTTDAARAMLAALKHVLEEADEALLLGTISGSRAGRIQESVATAIAAAEAAGITTTEE